MGFFAALNILNEKIMNYEKEAYDLLNQCIRISPLFLMRKFKLTYAKSYEICLRVWLRQHLEARMLAKNIESR